MTGKIKCTGCSHHLNNCNWCFETAREYPFIEEDGDCPYYDEKTEFSKLLTIVAMELVNILIEKNQGYGSAFFDGLEKIKDQVSKIPIDKKEPYLYMHYLGIWQRLNDKLSRFFNLIFSENTKTKDEAIYDAMLDITGYGLLSLTYYNQNYNKELNIKKEPPKDEEV